MSISSFILPITEFKDLLWLDIGEAVNQLVEVKCILPDWRRCKPPFFMIFLREYVLMSLMWLLSVKLLHANDRPRFMVTNDSIA
jgi:hypothetical protein